MKNRFNYIFYAFIFIIFSSLYFWYGYTKYVPKKVIEVGKTFIANESIRHILKVSILNEKGFNLYLIALREKNDDLVDDSLDLIEASLGFIQIYEITDKRVFDIKKDVYSILELVDNSRLDISDESLVMISKKVNNINLIVEDLEKNKWHTMHSQIVLEEAGKFKTLVVVFYLLALSIVLIFVILFINRKKSQLEQEKIKNHKLLLNQSKVAAVGEMLGNIAHQWRQPLSVISTISSGMKFSAIYDDDIDKEKIIEYGDAILKQSKYLSKTIDDFRNFFMANSENIERIDLKRTYDKLEDLTDSIFKNNFIVKITKIDENIEFYSNESILIQSFINICNNTKDVFCEREIDSNDRYFFTTIKKTDNIVTITFKDSGGGIKEELLHKIFDPYFTTKHQSLGTGIGLYMTHQIITKHFKGEITARNTEFEYDNKHLKGALFEIKLDIEKLQI